VEPGQEFSFNKTVGMPTEAKGYKKGTVYGDGGVLTEELGGGMCQVSSTLYNVALDTKMEITERHPHSKPVPYVNNGRDATIYDDKDFRFRNTTDKPILIKSWASNGNAYVSFYAPQNA
jgi:vancomycin resistance protein YoaR